SFKMPELHKAGVAYLLAIGHFFYQSAGFVKFYNDQYAYWKCIPLLVLISFVAIHGGVPTKTRTLLAIALAAGSVGDFVIGSAHDGIVPGAVAFGIGHIINMLTFAPETRRICWPLAGAVLALNAVVGHFCVFPILEKSVIDVVILSVYSCLLAAALIVAASQCFYGSSVHPAYAHGLKWRLLGYALFYLSDNILIIDHTVFSVPFAEHLCLSTYFAAQYLLVRAAVSCEKHKPKKSKSS
ncbi:hypothetical protein PENTCL1PPCAC_30394, partial [Pristionchus entomophagus]